jgi:hypothetical protein
LSQPKKRPTLDDFCRVLFEPNEATCLANTPYGTDVYTIAQARQSKEPPAFFTINPLRYGTKRADANVTSLRNFLIECDNGELKTQHEYIKALGMPYSTLVFSGSKSLHYVISLETPIQDRAHYAALAKRIHKAVLNCDHTTKNPSRLSRWPGHFREEKGKIQYLLEVKERVPNEVIEAWLTAQNIPYEEPTTPVDDIFEGMRFEPNSFTKHFVYAGANSGERNKQLYLAAHDLRACGYSYEQAIEYLETSPVCSEVDFSRKEFERTILSAFQKIR